MGKDWKKKKVRELMRVLPQEPGDYWARSSPGLSDYDRIVTVEGVAPMLYVTKMVDLLNDQVHIDLTEPPRIVWGPMVEYPKVPKSQVVKIREAGGR